MKRREFTTLSIAAAGGLWLPGAAFAQRAPVEGTHFVKVSGRQPTLDPKRIDVVEFFWYGCPHCHSFEPQLDAWQKKLPPDVAFRRMPVAFRQVPFVLHQQLYFAIETMGLVEQLHRKVFYAMHVERNKLDTPEAIAVSCELSAVSCQLSRCYHRESWRSLDASRSPPPTSRSA